MNDKAIVYMPSSQLITLKELNMLQNELLKILSDRNLKVCDAKYILKETLKNIDMVVKL